MWRVGWWRQTLPALPSPLCGPLVPSLGMASLSSCPHPTNPNRHNRMVKLPSQGKGFQLQAEPPPPPLSPKSPMGAMATGASERPQKTEGPGCRGAEPRWVSLGKPGPAPSPCVLTWEDVRRMRATSLGEVAVLVSILQTRTQAQRGGRVLRTAGAAALPCTTPAPAPKAGRPE